jgi:ABC-2 type transport system ATP-binding protein
VAGRPYRALRRPLFQMGAMLEAAAVHPGRSARGHLLALAAANAIPRRRVDEVLGLTGLEAVAGKRAGWFSLGMTQRLGLAVALLGDPGVLLDEPVNGLDPDGVRWIRTLLRSLAAHGRTVSRHRSASCRQRERRRCRRGRMPRPVAVIIRPRWTRWIQPV